MPAEEYLNHHVKIKDRVYRHADGRRIIFHVPRRLADFPPYQKKETGKPEQPHLVLKGYEMKQNPTG